MFLHDYLLACEISTVRSQTLKVLMVTINYVYIDDDVDNELFQI